MKYEILLLCLIVFLQFFTGCLAKNSNPNSEITAKSSVEATEEVLIDTGTKEEVYEEIKAFLQAHPSEMENCAAAFLTALEEEEEKDLDYAYYPDGNILYWYEGGDYHPKGKVTEHPILDAVQFLANTEVFDVVCASLDQSYVGGSVCSFQKFVINDGEYMYRIYLIYSEEDNIEKEGFPLEPLAEHWYINVQPLY